jgi:hypothetical protein
VQVIRSHLSQIARALPPGTSLPLGWCTPSTFPGRR